MTRETFSPLRAALCLRSRKSTGITGNGLSPYRAVSKPPTGGMTFGPWLVALSAAVWPSYVIEAVDDRSFQTMRESSPAFLARASTTSVAVVPEAIDESFQLIEPAVTVTVPAFLSARADW